MISGDRVVVFDLEYTAWEGSAARNWSGPGEYREIIQVGAVELDATLAELSSFSVYVRPTRNPELSPYITALTGITNERIAAEGRSFADALVALVAFVRGAMMICSGSDAGVLRENCALNGLAYPFDAGQTLDVRPLFRSVFGDAIDLTSSRLPSQLGLALAEDPHTGLGDARAITSVLRLLRGRGQI